MSASGELYIGVMSGTSLDGVDIALCEIDSRQCTLIHSHEYSIEADLKEEILNLIANPSTLFDVGNLNAKLGSLFGECIHAFLQMYEIEPSSVKAIGLHGQTLWHSPEGENPFSMQLGCPNIVHAKTNIPVIADFRSMDIANGGQGAPFAPAFHQFLFASLKEKVGVLNIGGMANITILGENLRGWDTGIGNVLLDAWVKECKYFPYDKDGEFAKTGKVNQALLESFLSDAYFKLEPPKSTGREYFNWSWLSKHLEDFKGINKEDVQRTLLEFTAQTIQEDAKSSDIDTLIVCGGGAKNSFLMQRLQELFHGRVKQSDSLGVSASYMEAMAFAWLAYKRVHKQVVDLKSVTGAQKNSILGGIYG